MMGFFPVLIAPQVRDITAKLYFTGNSVTHDSNKDRPACS